MTAKKENKKKLQDSYTAESIEVLSGLDPVRKRPGMYTDTTRPNHLAHEAIDNSVDEAIAGHATAIQVTVYKDGSLAVEDDGRGMPIEKHSKFKISGVELILTRLHAGAKFSEKTYRFSGGLHGVGISVVNALSKKLNVQIKKGTGIYEMNFAKGKPLAPLKKIGRRQGDETGTRIRFWPDPQYFDAIKFSLPALKHTLRAKAVLCPGLTVRFTEEITQQTTEWYYQEGLKTYLENCIQNESVLPEDLWVGDYRSEEQEVSWALAWSLEPGAEVTTESYVNLIPTAQGGTHVSGLRTGLLEAMREFCQLHNLLPKQIKLVGDDLLDQCYYILSLKMKEPQFLGQTKERLSSRQAATFVSSVIKDAFILWLNRHVEVGKQLAELVIERAQKRFRTSKKVARKRLAAGPALPGKLADCTQQEAKSSELFLVEGDSAGGSAKQGRDKQFQAVMPLRGKILNTWEVDSDQVLASQTVNDIAIAIGVDPGSEDLAGLRYGRVCILADADSDGYHIATLLCALFMKHFPKLVMMGHVYVAMPPLYRIDVGKTVFYALSDSEKEDVLTQIAKKKLPGEVNIQRFKGLGEMNPDQLRETTMNPETRRLVQLTVSKKEEANQMLDMLLAKKRASDRRKWLESKGNLAMG